MIDLDNIPTGPYWLDLDLGVRLQVRPHTGLIHNLAFAYADDRLEEEGGDDLPEREAAARRDFHLVNGLALQAVVAWEGVKGDPPVTPEGIQKLMTVPVIAQGFFNGYMGQYARYVSEGESSPAAANGTSAAGRATATGAETPTSLVPEGDAATTDGGAPTANTGPKRKPGGKSGK